MLLELWRPIYYKINPVGRIVTSREASGKKYRNRRLYKYTAFAREDAAVHDGVFFFVARRATPLWNSVNRLRPNLRLGRKPLVRSQ